MNRRILVLASAPAVVIGLLFAGVCLGSAWYINRLQTEMADILSQNVSSLEAAQELEITLRQLRFHCFHYLIDPDPAVLPEIQKQERLFEKWLGRARETANVPEEWVHIHEIEAGFARYRKDFYQAQAEVTRLGPRRDFRRLADDNPVGHVVEPCHALYHTNERLMRDTRRDSVALSRRLHLFLLLLGLGGPVSGLVLGYGMARGLSRSIYRLSLRVQDMTQHLDQHVASVNMVPDGDLQSLERQLQQAVGRVQVVAERLQHQQREILHGQQLAAVGRLAASVAHEVRNPLTAIQMLVEAGLRGRSPRPFTRDNLEVIHREVVRLGRTVQGFLDFARPPALERQAGDLRGVIAQAVELVRTRARQQKVELDVDVPDFPVTSRTDRGQLCTVLVNLLINALDAMPAGGRLEVALEAPAGLPLRLTVADTGPGIPAELAGRLFTPFVSTRPTGTGLGLSVSRRVIEDHGGTIAFANRAGGGACFTITLPESCRETNHALVPGH